MPLIQQPDALYHARWEISNSMLSELNPPYRFYKTFVDVEPDATPKEQTPAQILGTVVHMLMLEPEAFDTRYVIAKKFDRRTNAGKEAAAKFEAENIGKTIVDEETFAKAEAMAHAAFNHAAAAELLRMPGMNEVTVTFDYPHDGPAKGFKCRGRLDKIVPPTKEQDGCIIDIKTAADASPEGFRRAITNFKYHKQAMFYRDGLAASGKKGYEGAADWPFFWIVVESKAPFCVGVYTMDDLQVQRGRQLYQTDMLCLGNCLKENKWPQYTDGIETILLPPWAYSDFEPTEAIG